MTARCSRPRYDLIKAQAEYARLIRGAAMILMLSTMLHSIGWEYEPAGVELVCVDINPAVVTKLADRAARSSRPASSADVGLLPRAAAPPARPTT